MPFCCSMGQALSLKVSPEWSQATGMFNKDMRKKMRCTHTSMLFVVYWHWWKMLFSLVSTKQAGFTWTHYKNAVILHWNIIAFHFNINSNRQKPIDSFSSICICAHMIETQSPE